jgi:eukaryotic-like serine/threonine-protein kinase
MHTGPRMELLHLGRYRLVAPLGVVGHTSRSFAARHEDEPEDGAPSYVVKLLDTSRGGDGDARRARFEHESRLLRACNHPSIPTVHAAGEQDGMPYVVLDRVDGIDLATLLGHGAGGSPQALGRDVAVYVLAQIVDAVRHVHELEIEEGDRGEIVSLGAVHRGLSPSSVLCSRTGDVVIWDFSCARSRWLAPEHDDRNAGDLAYWAPERLDGAADARSDMFSVAVLLWEMLRGQRCLAGADAAATREALARFDISQPARRVPGLSPKLGEVLRKNLDRDPARRYEDAYQMLQRLAQAPEAAAAERSREALGELVAKMAPPMS